jgi:hypothetical protein
MSVLDTIGRTVYQLGFEVSPIIFSDGIAAGRFGYLPIIAITEGPNLLASALSGSNPFNLDKFFAHFTPVPGGKLANFAVAQYPFANQSVAANAIISEPLTISMRMSIPVNKPGGHTAKLITMTMLQSVVQKHANLGGTYIVATPAGFYANCILTGLTDVSGGDSPIPQNTWQWDFVQPLVTLQAAQAAQNTLTNALSRGLPTNGSLNATAGSAAVPSVISGTGIAGVNPIAASSPSVGVQGPNQ